MAKGKKRDKPHKARALRVAAAKSRGARGTSPAPASGVKSRTSPRLDAKGGIKKQKPKEIGLCNAVFASSTSTPKRIEGGESPKSSPRVTWAKIAEVNTIDNRGPHEPHTRTTMASVTIPQGILRTETPLASNMKPRTTLEHALVKELAVLKKAHAELEDKHRVMTALAIGIKSRAHEMIEML